MPHRFLTDLQEGDAIHQFLLVRRVETRIDKSGKPYLALVLGDRSRDLEARVWSDVLAKCPGPFTPGDYVGVQAQVSSYKGEIQLSVQYISTVEALRERGRELKEFDPELLHRATPYDREQLWRELWELAEAHLKTPLKELVLGLLGKYQEELLVCPAARVYHHPYLGGLLEHTWSVARHALQSLSVYQDLHPDLVLAGAILHDLGKVKELANPQAPDITVAGALLGHIVLGWEMVREEARAQNFPDPALLLELEHIILSHHGSQEFGSPVPPKTREAMLVFYLDDLDAKLKMMDMHLESDNTAGDFTSYHRVLQRGLYKGGDRSEEEPAPTPESKKNN
ncbi:MAG: HD domain-containing protein [Deltaproteobacteria bacterium]|nr:HD domain-containing protein [Deltaproteobacteria bacterium]